MKNINKINAGDILVSARGFDAIYSDFYKVIKRTAKSVTLVKLKSKTVDNRGYEGWDVMPTYVETGKAFRRAVKVSDLDEYINVSDWESAFKWDGKPVENVDWH